MIIIELLLLGTGLWAIVSGKIPVGLFKLLFGKGKYELSLNQTRLFGLLLSSPLPVSYIVLATLTNSLGTKGIGYSIIFEIVYILIVITASIIIARKARHPETKEIDKFNLGESASEEKTSSYGVRLLIMFGIGMLGCVTTVSVITLIGVVISSVTVGVQSSGDFGSDIFPFVVMFTIIGVSLFGIFKLSKLLRK